MNLETGAPVAVQVGPLVVGANGTTFVVSISERTLRLAADGSGSSITEPVVVLRDKHGSTAYPLSLVESVTLFPVPDHGWSR